LTKTSGGNVLLPLFCSPCLYLLLPFPRGKDVAPVIPAHFPWGTDGVFTMKKIALAAALSLAASSAFAGGMVEPVMEAPMVEAKAASSSAGGIIVPLLVLLLVAAAASN
jgi:hypothetical protein